MDFHSLKRKELQALCKKHKIPANLTNLEMATRLTSLSKGKDKFFTGRRSHLKALDENRSENESDVENKRVKKVRFSPETQVIEFQKPEAEVLEIKRRGRRKSVINEVSVVENVGGPELCEGVGNVTRYRGQRLEEEGVAERKGRKRSVKDEVMANDLPSTADNVASPEVDNGEHRVLTRRSLRNREAVDEGKRKNEDVDKGSMKNGRQRNLRHGNDKGSDNVAKREESDGECVEVQVEKVLRRSKRNVTVVEDYKLLSKEMIATGSSLKPGAVAITECSGPSGVDTDAGKEEKEGSPIGVGIRRSRRNASRHETLITLDDVVADANYGRNMKRRRRDRIQEEETVEIDSITIEIPLRRSSRNANRSEKAASAIVGGKVAQREKRRTKKQTEEIEDSFSEDLRIKELPDVDIQPSMIEVAESAICRDSVNDGFVDNLEQQRKMSGKKSSRKSPPKAQDSLVGVNGEITASESAKLKNDDTEPETETSHIQTKVVAQDVTVIQEIKKKNSAEYPVPNSYSDEPATHFPSGTAEQECLEDLAAGRDAVSSGKITVADGFASIEQSYSEEPKGIQIWIELSTGMQELSGPASPYHIVEDEGISSEKIQELIEHEGLDRVRDDVLEKYVKASVNGPCERVGFSPVKDKTLDADPASSDDAMTAMVSGRDHFTKAVDPNYADDSSTLNSGRALDQRDPSKNMRTNGFEVDNVNQEKLKCTESANSDEHNPLEENYDAPDKCCESNIPEPSRSVTSNLEGGKVDGREDFNEPADLLGKHLASPSIAANAMDTNCTPIESRIGVSSSGSTKIPLAFSLTLEDPEYGAVSATIVKSDQSFLQDTNVQKQDVKRSAELPKSVRDDKFGESNAFDSSGCKLGIMGHLDGNVGKDFVGDADFEWLVLAAQDFAAQTIEGSKKSYEDEPEKDGNADFIESCVKETEKKDSKYEKPEKSEVSMAEIISGTGNSDHLPTGVYIEESATTTMKLDITLEQKEQSPILQMYGSEYDNVDEEDSAQYEVELNFNELAQSVEDTHFEEQHHSLSMFSEASLSYPSRRSARRLLKDDIINGGEDSTKGRPNTAGLKPEKAGSAGSTESRVREECPYPKKDKFVENPVNSEDAMTAMKRRTSISPHVSAVHNNDESTSGMKLDKSLEQREQSPNVHQNCCDADSVAEVHKNYNQVELKCNEFSKSANDRPLDEQYHSPSKCWESTISGSSIRSARSMLQDEIVNGEDSIKHKNAAGTKKNYKDVPDKDENDGFIQSCLRKECTSTKKENNYEENPVNYDDAMAAMKCGTGNFPHILAVHNRGESSSTMNLEISLGQRELSLIVHRNCCEAESLAEVVRNYDQVEPKCDELFKSVEGTPLEEKHNSPRKCSKSSTRSILQGGEDSIKCKQNTASSRKTYEDGNIDFTDSCTTGKCISDKNDNNCKEVPVHSGDPREALISRTGDFAHTPQVNDNVKEHTGSRNPDMALDQREQSPILQINGFYADNVAQDDRDDEQVELYCHESAESFEDRCLEERYHSPNKCLESSVSESSRRSAGRMLQDGTDSSSEDSIMHREKSYENAPEEDGNAGSVAPYVLDKYTSAKSHEDDPENSKYVLEAMVSGTANFAHIPVIDNNDDDISTMNSEITLEQWEQSPDMHKDGCETESVAEEDGNNERKDFNPDEFTKSVEDRPFEAQCLSPDKCWEPSASDPSRIILEDKIVNAGEDFSKSAYLLGTSEVTPSLIAKTVERNCSANEFATCIFNIGSTDPLDSSHSLDGPEFKEASVDANKSGHYPDKSVQMQEEIADAMKQSSSVLRNSIGADDVAEAYKNFEDAKNCVELASFERGNNDAEDVVDGRKFQGEVLDVQRRASHIIEETSNTSAESIPSPAGHDTQKQVLTDGDDTFAEDKKKENSDDISEKISDFASTELSEAKLTLNIQEEFSRKDEGNNTKERAILADTFSRVQFTMSGIHSKDKIVEDDIQDVASKLHGHHEMLEESDVADAINEYIDFESARNPSLRIDDTAGTLDVLAVTKVAEPEAKRAEETIDTTGRKYEPSVEEDDQEKEEAADLAETALGSACISKSKIAPIERKNSVVANEDSFLGKPFKSEMTEKNIRAILIHGTPKKLQMVADMKENVPSSKMEKIGSLTTVKPATKRPALKDLLQK